MSLVLPTLIIATFSAGFTQWVWHFIVDAKKTRRYLEREMDKLHQDCVLEAFRARQLEVRVAALESMREGPYR